MAELSKEGNVLFNDALNIFYLRLYGVGHIVKVHSDSERGNTPLHWLLFSNGSKVFFVCTMHRQDSTYHKNYILKKDSIVLKLIKLRTMLKTKIKI